MRSLAFINATIYAPEVHRDHVLLVEGEKIVALLPRKEFENLDNHSKYEIVDCQGQNLSPGFIDLQLNGCGGVNFNENEDLVTRQTLETMLECNLRHGCTTFLPTLITNPYELRAHAIKVVADLHAEIPSAVSYVPGLHLEGPHISLAKKGTHNPNFIAPMEQRDCDLYTQNARYIKMLTLAPEENSPELIKALCDAGICVSIGHTNASYEQAMAGAELGMQCATHLYNAQTAISNGRNPGVVGAVYDNPNLGCGIIVDGIHVQWPLVRLTLQTKGDKVFVVTDAVAPAGTDITEFEFANKIIKVVNQGCYDENGTLSGSAITMDSSLQRLQENTQLDIEALVRLVTLNPARQIGMENQIGALVPQSFANIVVFDNNFNVRQTYLNGELRYQAK